MIARKFDMGFVLLFAFILMLCVALAVGYVVPKARIEVLRPKGFSVSIADHPGIQSFAFHGNLNSPMEGLENGQFSADVLKHKNGRWTFTDRKHEIKPGDILYYWLYVQKDSLGYRRDDQKHEFTEADVYGGLNSTEETSTEYVSTDYTERPIRPTHTNHGTSTTTNHGTSTTSNHGTTFNENCNASTPPMRVFPQEVHHYHHHFLPTLAPSGSCPQNGGGGNFGGGNYGGNGGFQASSGGGPGGSTGFNFPAGQDQQAGGAGAGAGATGGGGAGSNAAIQQLQHQMKQVMLALENMKLRVATLSDVVDELINTSGNTKLILTGAQIDSTTNLFELVRHIILDRLELKDLKNDIYSATRTKKGIVFDVASGLDKRRILARARERLNRDDEELRIQDYYDESAKPDDESAESLIDVRFGGDE